MGRKNEALDETTTFFKGKSYYKARKDFVDFVCNDGGRKPCKDCAFNGKKVCISNIAKISEYRQAIKEYKEAKKNV